MIWLARLLILERWRRLQDHYGATGCTALAAMLLLLAWIGGSAAAAAVRKMPGVRIQGLLNYLWLAWVATGMLLGRDLTWRLRLERLKIFPVPGFHRLYLTGWLLSFISFPLAAVLLAVGIAVPDILLRPADWLPALAGFILLVSSARFASSVGRAFLSSIPAFPKARVLLWSAVLIAGAVTAALWVTAPEPANHFPGYQWGTILIGAARRRPLLELALLVLPLCVADFLIERNAVYSSPEGRTAPSGGFGSGGQLLLAHYRWPAPLWRICLLGWLRSRNAVLLFAWGTLYSFFFMYFTDHDDPLDYLLFCFMALVFHAYLRGNLLGVDQSAVWAYYMLPIPVHSVLRAKNQTLSLLQACMITAVLLPAVLHPFPAMDATAWLRVSSLAYCCVLVGEICGTYFSLAGPEPIDRTSQFSGGMTIGALLVPVIQIVFGAAFLGATGILRRHFGPPVLWPVLIAIPAGLRMVPALLTGYVQRTLVKNQRTIFAKLSVFSS